MAKDFIFEAPSDEELVPEPSDQSESYSEDTEAQKPHETEEDDEDNVSDADDEDEEGEGREQKNRSEKKAKQSPWDFASYSESVAEEHSRRSTTSIDDKISRALQQRTVPVPDSIYDGSDSSYPEPDKQVEYRADDDDGDDDEDENANAEVDKKKAFFASAEGASFHANSFIELNLSRPLLRACEDLGYTKPTPIQVLFLLA